MHRGYALCSPALDQVLCLSSDRTAFVMEPVNNISVLNKAMCLPDLTESNNILKRIKAAPEYTDVVGNIEIQNIARLYNKFF